jgi:transcription elongation factor Elf1
MGETIDIEDFNLTFSYNCPKCEYLNEIQSNELHNNSIECGMCETVFKFEGLDSIKIIANLE